MSKMLKVVGASWLQTKISSYILGFLGVLAILALFVGQIERIQEDGTFTATVFYSKKTGYSIDYWGQSNELAEIQRGVARAYFRMNIDTTGWSVLEIETDGSYPDEVQAYAAGIVEGALTWYPIHAHLDNTIRFICEEQEKDCDKLHDALEKSVNSWKAYAAQHQATDPFWHQVFLYYTQMRGVYTGWKHGVERSMNEYDTDISDLYWLNALNDVIEYQRKLNITLEDNELANLPPLSSAFLRLVEEESDNGKIKKLFVAHNTAGSYTSMTRILKRYKLNYHQTSTDGALPIPCNSVEFSGYPGSITSQDEFYTVSGKEHKLAITGTPLYNYNSKLWKDVNIIERLPVGPRITAANHLATNVSSWGHILASSNSGTASKQWLVADFNILDKLTAKPEKVQKITKDDLVTEVSIGGQNNDTKHTVVHRINSNAHVKGLLWLIEQVPSRTHSADLSDVFYEQGYWATYGLPFFKDIANLTAIKRMEELYGKIYSETESPRANIFKTSHVNATTKESIFKFMRQTNFSTNTNDTNNDNITNYTDEKYWTVLGIRWDLETNMSFGVIDTKIAIGVAEGPSLFTAISGPPYTQANTTEVPINKGNIAPIYTDQFDDEPTINGMEMRDLIKHYMEEEEDGTPPFAWSESAFNSLPHEGLPDTWEFKPYMPKWSW